MWPFTSRSPDKNYPWKKRFISRDEFLRNCISEFLKVKEEANKLKREVKNKREGDRREKISFHWGGLILLVRQRGDYLSRYDIEELKSIEQGLKERKDITTMHPNFVLKELDERTTIIDASIRKLKELLEK